MAFAFKHGDRPLDGYTIQRGVGRGGFGEVYFAVSDGGREVALKYLRESPQVELRGVSHCINLKSPYLVTIFDVKKNADGEYFVVMEYVNGPSLRDILIAEPNGIGVPKTAFFLRELAKGLSYLHDRGIVHRDLKPGNIFYDDGYVKIGDYGLSKCISESRHTQQTVSVGTLHYMAPEMGSGDYSRSVDIYALGVIAYEMLRGRVPFEGGSAGEVLIKHLTAQPDLTGLPAPFDRVIARALAKDPNQRYATVDEMVADVFLVDHVRDSMVGFNPTSLSQAAARIHVRTEDAGPRVSPPPLPPWAAGASTARSAPVGERSFRSRRGELTPEARSGRVTYAGFWIRFVAAAVDGVLVFIAGVVLTNGLGGMLLGLAYESLLLAYWEGQTLGRRVCKVRVINQDGTYCDLRQAVIRSLAEILSTVALMLGYLWVAIDPYKRGWHDHIAGTLNVRVQG